MRLAGSLVLPPGAGPHPAVILIHGSAPMGREDWEYRSWADLFARRGVAALFYDKRGVGASTGQWETASLDDLTDDVLAALDAPVFRYAFPDDRRLRVEEFPHADHGLEVGSGRIGGGHWRFLHKADGGS